MNNNAACLVSSLLCVCVCVRGRRRKQTAPSKNTICFILNNIFTVYVYLYMSNSDTWSWSDVSVDMCQSLRNIDKKNKNKNHRFMIMILHSWLWQLRDALDLFDISKHSTYIYMALQMWHDWSNHPLCFISLC